MGYYYSKYDLIPFEDDIYGKVEELEYAISQQEWDKEEEIPKGHEDQYYTLRKLKGFLSDIQKRDIDLRDFILQIHEEKNEMEKEKDKEIEDLKDQLEKANDAVSDLQSQVKDWQDTYDTQISEMQREYNLDLIINKL